MTLEELYNWHCNEGDKWLRLSEEERSTAAQRYKEATRRAYARKAQFHKEAAACIARCVTIHEL